MVALPREVEKWLLSLDLRNPIHRPKWDMANGCAVAEILSVYHPRKVYYGFATFCRYEITVTYLIGLLSLPYVK